MKNKRKQSQQKCKASGTINFLKNKDPLSKERKHVFYKLIITDLKYVQNFPGDIGIFKETNSYSG